MKIKTIGIFLVLTLGFGCSTESTRPPIIINLKPNRVVIDVDRTGTTAYVLTQDTTTGFIYYEYAGRWSKAIGVKDFVIQPN